MVIDVEKCENCNNCFLACKDEHVDNDWPEYSKSQPAHGHKWINIQSKERGQFPLIDVAYLPVPCMHCDNAPCIKASNNGAIYKRPDGIVIIDPVKAKGQKTLLRACPYHAIWWNDESDIPQKCTFCAHLLDGKWGKTRCVQSCPTGALSIYLIGDNEMQKMIQDEHLEAYHPEYDTNPRVYYKNLFRFTRCFIGGSVATRINNKDECVEGASISLHNSAGEKVAECLSDNYGDFKFDNLEENSGKYILKIFYNNSEIKSMEVDLKTSINIGTIFM